MAGGGGTREDVVLWWKWDLEAPGGVMLFQQEPQVLSMAKLSGAEGGGGMAQSQTPGKSSKVQVQGHPAPTQLGDL